MNLKYLIDENGKLVIPHGVTRIKSEEFLCNDDLTTVEIPKQCNSNRRLCIRRMYRINVH
jgi:hypothetical protein